MSDPRNLPVEPDDPWTDETRAAFAEVRRALVEQLGVPIDEVEIIVKTHDLGDFE